MVCLNAGYFPNKFNLNITENKIELGQQWEDYGLYKSQHVSNATSIRV